jgi:hypothetical protein
MIHYQLQCEQAHAFDGWFKDSLSFEHQAQSGLIACPACNSVMIKRALMVPALGRGSRHRDDSPTVDVPPSSAESSPRAAPASKTPAPNAMLDGSLPDNLRALLQRLRTEVEKTHDYVGSDFADEARRIHHGESEVRSIYGETTRSEAEALADEGIEFGVIPWLPRSDS